MKLEECLKLLNENAIFQNALNMSKSESEKEMIKNAAEGFLNKIFSDFIEPTKKAIENDPEALNKVFLEVEKDLINNNTGSQEV